MVWAGDQLLWEIRTASETPGEESGPGGAYGTVSYTHALGIDRPLVITKGTTSILPHQNWRGQFSAGTYATGVRSDCPEAQSPNCHAVAWPGWRTSAWHADAKEPDIRVWWGGLVDGMRDASGQMYMRNRYYDPATGQFTQQDPIGLAGGLNSYGFAAGDPVSYSDPYGLKAEQCPPCRGNENTPEAIEREVQAVESRSGNDVLLEGATVLAGVGAALIPQAGAAILVRLGVMSGRAVPVAGAAAGAGAAANKVAGRVPWDGFQAWGREVVQWGRGAPDAFRRASEITAEQAARIDPRKVDMARQFYENAVSNGRGGDAAPARVELMKRIAELQQR